MASLAKDRNGWRILFVAPNGSRKTLRLPRGLEKKGALSVKVKVESLLAAQLAGTPPPQDVAAWLGSLGDDLYKRLRKAGLVAPRESRLTVREVAALWLEEAKRAGVKPSTLSAMRVGVAKLVEFLGSKPISSVTLGDATAYRDFLTASGLRPSTVARRIKHARHLFHEAQKKGFVQANVFQDVKLPPQNPAERRHYVTLEDTQRLIESAPNHHWRLLIALSRYAGLRVPSEALSLRWQDVLWDRDSLVVPSPKTERAGKPYRVIPLFPLLRPYLEEAFERADEGDEYIFPAQWRQRSQGPNGWINCNLRTQFERIIRRAGLEPWPRVWHNLRASAESDLAQDFPLATVARWFGNSPSVALKHYVDPTDTAFERAVHWYPQKRPATEQTITTEVRTKCGTVCAQNAAQQIPATTGKMEKITPEVSKVRDFLPLSACPNFNLQNNLLGPAGFEPATKGL